MLTDHQLHRYNSLVRKVYASSSVHELRVNVLSDLQQLVPYHNAAFFLVNPQTLDFSEPLFHGLDSASFTAYRDYYQNHDRYKKSVFSQGNIPISDRSSDYMNYRDWEDNEHRADFLLPQGIYHMACMQVFHQGQISGEISLHRNKQQPDFSNDEMTILNLLHDHVNARLTSLLALQDAHVNTYKDPAENLALCFLDKNCQLQGTSPAALVLLHQSLTSGQNVYSHIKDTCCGLYQQYSNVLSLTPAASRNASGILKLKSGYCRFQILLIQDEARLDSISYLVLLSHHNIRKEFEEWQFTNREAQIVSLITQGRTNKQIARDLGVSENTIKTFIKRLFNKMGVHSRSGLISEIYKLNPPV